MTNSLGVLHDRQDGRAQRIGHVGHPRQSQSPQLVTVLRNELVYPLLRQVIRAVEVQGNLDVTSKLFISIQVCDW